MDKFIGVRQLLQVFLLILGTVFIQKLQMKKNQLIIFYLGHQLIISQQKLKKLKRKFP